MTNPAESYERSIVPYLFRPWAARLVEDISLAPGERVLDVACGTGIVAREAVGRVGPGGWVLGTDISAAMLDVAEGETVREGLPIEYREAEAAALPVDDGAVDVVLCQQGLQFTPDRAAAVREMHRVLAPGGRIAVSVWREIDLHPFFKALDGAMREHLDVGAAAMPFSFGDPGALGSLLAEAGFEEIAVTQPSMPARYPDPERNLYETISALVAVAPSLQAYNAHEREQMIETISEAVRDPHAARIQDDHVVLEWHANVAFARRAA